MASYGGESAFSFRKDYVQTKDEATYIEDLETKNDISISNYKTDEKRNPALSCTETYDFASNGNTLGDEELIVINPLLFEGLKNNVFKSEERKLPVEFYYPRDERINVSFTIPEGYAIEEVPVSEKYLYGDSNLLEYSYIVQKSETTVQIAYRLTIKTCIVPATEYELLRDFWAKICAKNNQVIVLPGNTILS
ncbi:hypothetical protein AGMMS50262_15600 [Bacteroidia bacterium]|nr:hypothetical protein AGMMS50262_15600 [Bacteroidia bacterium]